MNERELDSAIDAAAGTLMAREPSRALAYRVMARVRERPPPPRPFVWIAAAATIALCAAIATVVMNQAPPAIRLPLAAKLAIAEAAVVPGCSGWPPAGDPAAARRRCPEFGESVSRGMLPPDDASTIEPIETEPIALSMIEVPQLERKTCRSRPYASSQSRSSRCRRQTTKELLHEISYRAVDVCVVRDPGRAATRAQGAVGAARATSGSSAAGPSRTSRRSRTRWTADQYPIGCFSDRSDRAGCSSTQVAHGDARRPRDGSYRAAFEDRSFGVDARPTIVDGRIRVYLTIQSDATRNFGPPAEQDHTLNWRNSFSLLLENGKPMLALETNDAVTKRKMSIEVKATIQK